jgi:hypothetical protein
MGEKRLTKAFIGGLLPEAALASESVRNLLTRTGSENARNRNRVMIPDSKSRPASSRPD